MDVATNGLHQETLPDFILVRTDEVDEGERLRPVDPVWAGALGQIMLREGQRTPIEICRLPGRNSWTLVSGAHRLAGGKAAGIEHLRAEVVSAERDSRRLREVSENLWRRDLAPIDRAAFVAEAVAIHKRRAGIDPARDGRVASAAARWKQEVKAEADDATVTMTVAYGFTDKVAVDLGLSSSAVERDLMLYRRLPASLVERLRARRHPILANATQLRALAKLETDQRDLVVDTMLSTVVGGRTIATVTAALAVLGERKPLADPEAKRLSAFIGAFSRMGIAEKKAALGELAGMLPAGFVLTEPRDFAAKSIVGGADPNFRFTPATDPTARDDTAERALLWLVAPEQKDLDADYLTNEVARRYGGRARFTNGTCELKVGGVVATSTAGGANLLRAWIRKAAEAPSSGAQ